MWAGVCLRRCNGIYVWVGVCLGRCKGVGV